MRYKGNQPGASTSQTGTAGQLFHCFALGLVGLSLVYPLTTFCSDVDTVIPICNGCHGQSGASTNSIVPIIAGQAFTLIEDNLLAFRDAANACAGIDLMQSEAVALRTAMCALVADMEDEQFSALAEYYEQQTFVPAQQSFDPVLAGDGAAIHLQSNCEQCHAQGGRESNGMAAILAGQWTPYLESSLLRIRAGKKMGPIVMNEIIHEFTDADINALLSYYASQQN